MIGAVKPPCPERHSELARCNQSVEKDIWRNPDDDVVKFSTGYRRVVGWRSVDVKGSGRAPRRSRVVARFVDAAGRPPA